MDNEEQEQKTPATMREASREDYWTGTPSVMGYVYKPTTEQLQIGALQRLADAAERIATQLEKIGAAFTDEGSQPNG